MFKVNNKDTRTTPLVLPAGQCFVIMAHFDSLYCTSVWPLHNTLDFDFLNLDFAYKLEHFL